MRSMNFISPPTWSDLSRKLIFCTCICLKGSSHIISKRTFGLGIVGITRFQELFADKLTVYKDFVDTQASRHPFSGHHLLFILHGRHKPIGTIGRPVVFHITGLACHHRCINYRNPLRRFPSGCIEGIDTHHLRCGLCAASGKYNCHSNYSKT